MEYFPVAKARMHEIKQDIQNGKLDALKIACYYCGHPGHVAQRCLKKFAFINAKNDEYHNEISIFYYNL